MADAESLVPRAHRSGGTGTGFLELPDPGRPEGHPRRYVAPYAMGAGLRRDPRASPAGGSTSPTPSSGWSPPSSTEGRSTATPIPPGPLKLAVMGEGDELQGHYDQTDFVVSLAIEAAETGGDFDVAPRIRSADDENYPGMARVLDGDRDAVVTLAMTGSDLLRLDRYGRVEPFPEPPPGWRRRELLPGRDRRGLRGVGPEAAHLNTVPGDRGGPVETKLGERAGHAAGVLTPPAGAPSIRGCPRRRAGWRRW
ncbi:MAG TPA: hypothetical protein VMF60_06720 [Acidimicrobiales bacterium]|nr:hypothetical protein [Acidimicrobiales bacterium]